MAETSTSRVRRGRPNSGFIAISNSLLTIAGMSPEARLSLVYLLSKPADWELQIDDIRRLLGRSPDKPAGRNRAYAVVRELKDSRYVVACDDLEHGRFVGVTYYVFDEPHEDPEAVREAHRRTGEAAARPSPCTQKGDAAPCTLFPDTENGDSTKERKTQKTESTTASAPSGRASASPSAKPTPKSALAEILDEAHADAVIEHRQRIRKPLTAHAARLLAGKFRQCADPNAAADAMIVNGWQGFEPSWLDGRERSPKGPAPPARIGGGAETLGQWAARQLLENQRSESGHVIEHRP